MYVSHHTLVIVAWLAAAGGRCIQQSDIITREVSVHLNSIEEFEWWVFDSNPSYRTRGFCWVGGWAYCWTYVVGLGAGRYCSLHLIKCQDGWLASLLALPMAQ